MSAESRSHLSSDSQKKFRRILFAVVALLVLVAVPITVNGELRLDIAQRLNLVPGADVRQIAPGDTDLTLLVLPVEFADDNGRPSYGFRAAALAREVDAGIELTFLDDESTTVVDVGTLEFWSGSLDGRYLLIRDTIGVTPTSKSVLVDLDTKAVKRLTPDQPAPTDIQGNWNQGAWEISAGKCGGTSPNRRFIACYPRPRLAWYLAGDWELEVIQFGNANRKAEVFRGLGFRPWLGWSADDSRLYFQNEHGIWVAEITDEMLS